jgi:hypothetical protein
MVATIKSSLFLPVYPYLCRPKKKDLFFTHFPQGSKSSPYVWGRQQGVTKNKLYNAKG